MSSPANPQAFNRFSYVLGNPLKYIDPSGHDGPEFQKAADELGITLEEAEWWYNFLHDNPDVWVTLDALYPDFAGLAYAQIYHEYYLNDPASFRSLEHNEAVANVYLTKVKGLSEEQAEQLAYLTNAWTAFTLGQADTGRWGLTQEEANWMATDPVALPSTRMVDEGICFEAGTLVMTTRGQIPIETIHVGDQALALGFETGLAGYFTVTAVFSHPVNSLLEVIVGDDVIHVTEEHPFWVVGKRWIGAGALNRGDCVQTLAGVCWPVVNVREIPTHVRVYNFTVAEAHTYFVTDDEYLVHNQCSRFRPPRIDYDAQIREVRKIEARNQPTQVNMEPEIPQGAPGPHTGMENTVRGLSNIGPAPKGWKAIPWLTTVVVRILTGK